MSMNATGPTRLIGATIPAVSGAVPAKNQGAEWAMETHQTKEATVVAAIVAVTPTTMRVSSLSKCGLRSRCRTIDVAAAAQLKRQPEKRTAQLSTAAP